MTSCIIIEHYHLPVIPFHFIIIAYGHCATRELRIAASVGMNIRACVPVQKTGFFSVAPAVRPCRVDFVSRGCLEKWPSAALGVVRARHWFCVFSSLFGEFPFWFLSVSVLFLSLGSWG